MQLTNEQLSAVNSAINTNQSVFVIAGAAGTGKTTIVKTIVDELPNPAVCAYTGKAASVLRKKGIKKACTIHRLMYKWNGTTFRMLPDLPYSHIIVDEASMVGKKLFDDLRSYGIPIIAVGDHCQLEPVGSGSINLMEHPDVILEEVHRYDNELLTEATRLRLERTWEPTHKFEQLKLDVNWADVIIVPFNKLRVKINQAIHPGPPRIGSKIICLQNNYKLGVFNGLSGRILKIRQFGDPMYCDVDFDGEIRENLPIGLGSFNKINPEAFDYQKYVLADFAYAITCHKSQGSEWPNVAVVYKDSKLWDGIRWLYTARTRASKNVRVYV